MPKVVVDETLKTRLHDLRDHVELCDESGQTVGHYLPAALYQSLLYAGVGDPPISQEEIERRLQVPGGRSLAEIWKSLEVTGTLRPL